ncbi:MAG TPA: glycosyltransferase family 39 protein [Candidatus Acidoferrales bacterium]|nr:glycosyltransferase family 39 protein [Candidatus Acidoferrales bacterium]
MGGVAANPALLRACVAIAVVCGLFFRFYHLDRKVFWLDETYSAIRAAGYSEEQVIAAAAAAHTAADLQAILFSRSVRHAPLRATVDGLVNEEPEHTPLYYLLAHLWVDAFGDSVTMMRLLSAIIGVLALPAMFWFCSELFRTAQAGWIGVALIAVSPPAVLYAQEARDYVLWTVTLVLACAALARALRLQTAAAWALQTILLTVTFYVSFLSVFEVLGFALFVALDTWHDRRGAAGPWLSFAAVIALISPWLVVLFTRMAQVNRGLGTTSAAHHYGVMYVMQRVASSLRLNFFDYELQSTLLSTLLLVATLALVAYALRWLQHTQPPRVWGLVYTLIAAAILPLVAHDLLSSGTLLQTRYLIPAFIGVDVALAGFFDSALRSGTSRIPARLWSAVFVAVLGGGIASCAVSSRATTWWNKYDERAIALAQTIDAAPQPLLASDNYVANVLTVAHYLRPDVAVHIRSICYLCTATTAPLAATDLDGELHHASDVYLLGPSPSLQAGVKAELARSDRRLRYWCIDVHNNCPGPLHLWYWID